MTSYKQNKFNLLREQSEGYTKLTTELVGSLGPPHSPSTGLPSENHSTVLSRAASAWERVVSLIGYFDLDPNRALDIILDVFSVNLVLHWQFFLALLSFSPWRGGHLGMKDWVEKENMSVDQESDKYRGKDLETILHIAEFGEEHAHSPPELREDKARVLAQVLGFKFSHYEVGTIRYVQLHVS